MSGEGIHRDIKTPKWTRIGMRKAILAGAAAVAVLSGVGLLLWNRSSRPGDGGEGSYVVGSLVRRGDQAVVQGGDREMPCDVVGDEAPEAASSRAIAAIPAGGARALAVRVLDEKEDLVLEFQVPDGESAQVVYHVHPIQLMEPDVMHDHDGCQTCGASTCGFQPRPFDLPMLSDGRGQVRLQIPAPVFANCAVIVTSASGGRRILRRFGMSDRTWKRFDRADCGRPERLPFPGPTEKDTPEPPRKRDRPDRNTKHGRDD